MLRIGVLSNPSSSQFKYVKKGKDGLAPGCANVATIGSNVTSNDLRFCQGLALKWHKEIRKRSV